VLVVDVLVTVVLVVVVVLVVATVVVVAGTDVVVLVAVGAPVGINGAHSMLATSGVPSRVPN
jgi:hypothetical protein